MQWMWIEKIKDIIQKSYQESKRNVTAALLWILLRWLRYDTAFAVDIAVVFKAVSETLNR